MSDLSATGCGCSNDARNADCGNGCGSILWIILLLSCCGGCGNGGSLFGGDGNNCIWIILLLCCCGGLGNGYGNGCGCGF